MTYDKVIDAILLFAKKENKKKTNGEYIVKMYLLNRHLNTTFSEIDNLLISEVIDEIDARAWLLHYDKIILKFAPATFS